VGATGEPDFVRGYLMTDLVESNHPPSPPDLVKPGENDTSETTVLFEWDPSSDPDGDPVVYRHCIWTVDSRFTYAACTAATPQLSRTAVLEAGTAYFWKVIAEDGRGGSAESNTWRLTTY